MKKLHRYILCALIVWMGAGAAAFEEFAVYPTTEPQQFPDVENGTIVWQQESSTTGWDIVGVDLFAEEEPAFFVVDNYEGDQQHPAVWNRWVVWQDNSAGDWDVYLTDITDLAVPQTRLLTNYYNDQIAPAIHGNTVVWQHQFEVDDWDIYAADITEPNDPYIYLVPLADSDQYFAGQQAPAIYRNRLVWQDDDEDFWDIASADLWVKNVAADQILSAADVRQTAPAVWGNWVVWQEDYGNGDLDIYAADIADPANPVESVLVSDLAAQTHPDISGHIVVWQDNRHGHEDIYGYNLITHEEFRITTDEADQINPAIDGDLVVWQDMRGGVSNIYAVWLDSPEAADCPVKPAGDVDGNCRVNLADFMKIAETWMLCNLDPVEACSN